MKRHFSHIPAGFKIIQEGQAKILYEQSKLIPDCNNKVKTLRGRKNANETNENPGAVFYNPAQEFNRDISILAIKNYQRLVGKPIDVLEALSGTGLRTVRYIKEIPNLNKIVCNDIDPVASELITRNLAFNQCVGEVQTMDAADLMHTMRMSGRAFDVVDLDPYGSAMPFLDPAIQCLKDGGLLCATFTDMRVLCDTQPQVCFYKYGATPLNKSYCHEQALRMVLFAINNVANKLGRSIEPILSLTVDFYIRLFLRVHQRPQECHNSITQISSVFQCMQCESFYLQRLGQHKTRMVNEIQFDKISKSTLDVPSRCGVCSGQLLVGGPIWNDKIHDVSFIKGMLDDDTEQGTSQRVNGILGNILDEDVIGREPLSFDMAEVCSHLHSVLPPKNEIIAGFRSLDYIICQTYYNPTLWKTNASSEVVYDIIKAWKMQKCQQLNTEFISERVSALQRTILERPISVEPCFDVNLVTQQLNNKRVLRKYIQSPVGQGPISKATG